MNKLTGNGYPAADLEAAVGQFYEDTDTGNVYECQSITNVPNGVTYNWVLRANGEHIDDHAEIFGSGGSGGSASKYKQPEWGADTAIVDILPEETHNAAQVEGGMAMFTLPSINYALAGGKVYEVKYNGTSYNCPCHVQSGGENGDMYCLGNVGLLGYDGVEMTEEPFVIILSYVEGVFTGQMIALDGSETVTLSIKGESGEIHKIPADYVLLEPMIVTITPVSGAILTNYTFDEIIKAINNGRSVFVKNDNYLLSFTNMQTGSLWFTGVNEYTADYFTVIMIEIYVYQHDGRTMAQYYHKMINFTGDE